MISVDIQTLIEKHQDERDSWKHLLTDLTTEVRLLRLELEKLGHLLVSEIDD